MIWGNYEFTFDDIPVADFWIIVNNYHFDYLNCICPPNNIIYILQEPTSVSKYNNDNHSPEFLKQFGRVITTQESLKAENVIIQQLGIPWLIHKSIDELIDEPMNDKSKLISIITSNKTYTSGHRNRIECAMKIKKYFGSYVDLYGRGFNNFNDKWDVLSPYRFHISIENSVEKNYFSEKIIDPILAYSLPIYHGCPNISDYFDLPDYLKISDLSSFDKVKKKIQYLIEDDSIYENNFQFLLDSRKKIFEKYNFFPMICSVMDSLLPTQSRNNDVFYKKIKNSKLQTFNKILQKKYFITKINILYNP